MTGKNKPKHPQKEPSQTHKSWQGRLTAEADEATAEFLASIDVDWALYRYDIAGSIVHARMLSEQKIITPEEFRAIRVGLEGIETDIAAGTLRMPAQLEDIHMVIESALIERIGEAGKKLHTGRSRNDQVALDLRLYVRDAVETLRAGVTALQKALVELARRQGRIVMPAYTHLQRAQPILLGHALMAYVEMLGRDDERLADCHKRLNVSPLGSGAVAGTSIPLDRARTAELLGFPQISRNSIDATSDRDFLCEFCFCCAMLAGHLSRWAEDWIIYCTSEFGFLSLADAYCTGSSMMPQKKNPDTLELIRGKSATTLAQLVGMMTLVKGLPLAYNRDLQDDKRFVFAADKAVRQSLTVAEGIVATASFRPDQIAADLDAGFLDATALAEYMVNRGVPFRQAHHVVGTLVAQAERAGKSLRELPMETMRAACEKIGPDVADYLGAANVVKRYQPEGSAGENQLDQQIKYWAARLE
ncbi:MAG: argininosuccinate lyase [Planctomycetes bacterium]|nr:argininosuccinate lyase [Planctomycetota bacterium]